MITPDRLAVLQRGAEYADLIDATAQVYTLDRWIVFAVCAQESRFDPTAIRREPGFWRRYGAATLRNIAASITQNDDAIARDFPELLYHSIGLMQTMVSVALEFGVRLEHPNKLCVPAIGLDAGCRKLRRCFDAPVPTTMVAGVAVREPTVAALLAYNGGGRPAYAVEVQHWLSDAKSVGVEGWT